MRVDKDEVLPQALMTGYSWAHMTPFLFGPCADFYMKEPIHEDTGSVLGEALSLLVTPVFTLGTPLPSAGRDCPRTKLLRLISQAYSPPLEEQGLG